MVLRSRKSTVKVYIQVILHHRSCGVGAYVGGKGRSKRRTVIVLKRLPFDLDIFLVRSLVVEEQVLWCELLLSISSV